MGAQQTGCCGSADTLPCCQKNAGTKGADIVKARPMNYPGLEAAEGKIAQKNHYGRRDLDDNTGHGSNSTSRVQQTANPPQQQRAGTVDGNETYEDGSTFVGQLSEGRRHGQGVWTSPSEQYSGQWGNDQRNGQGRQTWQDGRVYEGQFKDGKFDGHGRMEWHMPTGLMVYEGQYVDDLKHGSGRYIWPDSRVYEGQWHRGQRGGRGTYTNSLGQKREGVWRDDRVEKWLGEDGIEEALTQRQ